MRGEACTDHLTNMRTRVGDRHLPGVVPRARQANDKANSDRQRHLCPRSTGHRSRDGEQHRRRRRTKG